MRAKRSRLFVWLSNLKSPHRVIVSGLFTMCCVGIWFLSIYIPLAVWTNHSRLIIKKMKDQHIMCAYATSSCEALEQEIAQLKTTLQSHIEINKQDSTHNPLLSLLNQAQHHNLLLRHCSIEGQTDNQWYVKQNATISFEGSMQHMAKFFDSCKTSKAKIAFNNFNLTRSQEDSFLFSGGVSIVDSIKS